MRSLLQPVAVFAGEVRPYWGRTVTAGLLNVVAAASEAALLFLIGNGAARLGSGQIIPTRFGFGILDVSRPVPVLLCGLVLIVVRTTTLMGANWLNAWIAAEYSFRRRSALVAAYVRAPFEVQRRVPIGNYVSAVIWDVEAAQALVDAGLRGIQPAIGFLLLLAGSFILGPMVTVAVAGVASILFLGLRPLARAASRKAEDRSRAFASFSGGIHQIIAVGREITVFGVHSHFIDRAGHILESVRGLTRATNFLATTSTVLFYAAVYGVAVGGLATMTVLDRQMIESTVPILLLLMRTLSYGQQVQGSVHALEERAVHVARVDDLLAGLSGPPAREGFCEGDRTQVVDRVEAMELEKVSFTYEDGVSGLREVDLRLIRGEVVGIAGPSASGKSTLVNIVLGLLQPITGRVLVNGTDLRLVEENSWARQIAIVPQDVVLLDDTVSENIQFGRSGILECTVRRAAEESGIADEIGLLAIGYNEAVGERGGRFSGGQRQRICIARALAGEPSLVVLDEPTSSLDPKAEAVVHQALERLRQTAIVLVVTHRESTARQCDRLLVLKGGRLVFDGPPATAWPIAHSGGAATECLSGCGDALSGIAERTT